MYTMLILDDELAVVNSLAHNIPWEESGIAHVFKAGSADQALRLMGDYRIDLVISDIRMPGMDGLDFTEAVRSVSPHTKVIIMSGLDDFRLAQRAILLNVFRYMTKPVPYDELILAVRQALAQLEAELEQHQLLENAEQAVERSRPILQERYLQQWIVKGAVHPWQDHPGLDPAGLTLLRNGHALLLLVRVDEWHREHAAADSYGRLKLQKLIRETLFHGTPCIMFNDFDHQLVVLVQKNSTAELQAAKRYMDGMAELLLSTAKRSPGCTLSVFWSEQPLRTEEIHEEYLRLKERARFSLAWESGIIQGAAAETKEWDERQQALFGYPGFEQWVERLDKAQAISHLQDWFEGEDSKPALTYDMLLLIYYTVAGILLKASFRRRVPLQEWAKEEAPSFYSMQTLTTVPRLRSWCIHVTELYMDYMSDRSQHASNHLLAQAKKLITERLLQDFSVQDIATQLHLHPNYLSRLFTKETGMTLTDYTVMLRMEKAKALLAVPGIKVFEVAGQVGYESVSHFNRTFKRQTGMNPKEYQASLAAGNGE
ncbi:MAG: DNA-binding response regulator [Paenibacillaceae bacterium]|jgi:two-component system response regulator YesN|nr:DNA-binding response regulator [Paenibacillaceae bacterium]